MQCSFLQRCTNIKVAAVGILYTIHLLSAATMRKHRMLQLVRSVLWLCYVPLFSRMSATTGCFFVYHCIIPFQHCHVWISGNKPNLWLLPSKKALTVWRNYPLTLMYIWMYLLRKCCVFQSSSSPETFIIPFPGWQQQQHVHHPFQPNLTQESIWISSTLGKSTVCEEKLNNSRVPFDEMRPKSPYLCKKNAKW